MGATTLKLTPINVFCAISDTLRAAMLGRPSDSQKIDKPSNDVRTGSKILPPGSSESAQFEGGGHR
jgi:hypothetical protein